MKLRLFRVAMLGILALGIVVLGMAVPLTAQDGGLRFPSVPCEIAGRQRSCIISDEYHLQVSLQMLTTLSNATTRAAVAINNYDKNRKNTEVSAVGDLITAIRAGVLPAGPLDILQLPVFSWEDVPWELRPRAGQQDPPTVIFNRDGPDKRPKILQLKTVSLRVDPSGRPIRILVPLIERQHRIIGEEINLVIDRNIDDPSLDGKYAMIDQVCKIIYLLNRLKIDCDNAITDYYNSTVKDQQLRADALRDAIYHAIVKPGGPVGNDLRAEVRRDVLSKPVKLKHTIKRPRPNVNSVSEGLNIRGDSLFAPLAPCDNYCILPTRPPTYVAELTAHECHALGGTCEPEYLIPTKPQNETKPLSKPEK